jgi:hypothetical protein
MTNRNRLSICLLAVAVCVFAVPAMAQMTSTGIDCSQIAALHLLQQDNMRAGQTLIECGIVQGGEPIGGSDINYPAPPNILVSNRSCSSAGSCTKSENMVWENGSTVVVNYNDSMTSPDCYGSLSYSTNGGTTFTRVLPSPLCSGHSTNYGDPVLVWNARLDMWFAGDMAIGCGEWGYGLWVSSNGVSWTVGACAHDGKRDDRGSMWADNNPSSPYYGRMYLSYQDYGKNGAIYVTSSDDGVNWSRPVRLNGSFLRNIQITGGPDGTIFDAAMDEGTGGFSDRTNITFRSTDGGSTWARVVMGAPFPGGGDIICRGYFAAVSPIWIAMGGGQPGVGPGGVVHYVYWGRGVRSGDIGDIYYVRSTDNGSTWSNPIVLNTDVMTATQWMPSLAVTAQGKVFASWYDRRNTTDGENYQYWGRASTDNGATWQPDEAVSDVLIPQPLQPDPGESACFAGDYNYHSANGDTVYMTWTDGRNLVNGNPQQDVYFDKLTLR